MKIICDYRENDVIECLETNKIKNKKFTNIEILSQNLNLGDFLINNTILVERKTWSDLGASIIDGRYTEQSLRLKTMIKENPEMKVFYLIEGNIRLYIPRGHLTGDALQNALFALQYEKGFYVIQTEHKIHTAEMLLKMCEKHNRICKQKGAACETEDIPMIQTTKKSSQITKENIGSLMLSYLPGLSSSTAHELLSHFNNDIYEFMFEVNNDISCLECIKIGNRKISKSVIENIKTMLISDQFQ